ncbi:hypothetical protein KEM48_010164 [Puccinia striiformis f. sp. tritici PST-130]|nr:hypothetical protein H4Q26_010512 [Puccinia striiformis f. sp. tritici PST-130]KAI9626873.1 hypothetical protein KEM48_010164 [Puccinia striiformis f. sp. tritici PST-130]
MPHLKLIEGAVLTFLKAYDLVKSGAVEKLLGSRDDSLPAPNGVSGTAYALSSAILILKAYQRLAVVDASLPFANRSISAELHLFGPIVAISAALGDMTLPSDEPCCSLENCLTREMNQTSQSVGDSNQERPNIQDFRNAGKARFDLIYGLSSTFKIYSRNVCKDKFNMFTYISGSTDLSTTCFSIKLSLFPPAQHGFPSGRCADQHGQANLNTDPQLARLGEQAEMFY